MGSDKADMTFKMKTRRERTRFTFALVTLISGIFCQTAYSQNFATQYDGTTGYVNCGSSINSSINTAGKLTVETRFRMTTSPGSWDSPCGTYHSGTWLDGGFGLYYNGSMMNFYIYDYIQNVAKVTFDPANTSWHHLAGTWDKVTGVMTIYIDGVSAGTDNYTGTIGPITTDVFQIGAANSSYNWKGQLDEVRVWNVVRTQAQIQANMNTQLTGSETGLLAYYKMEEGIGTSLTDATVNGNTGTMTAGVTWVGAPTISSFTPTSASAGTTVTLNGSIFTGTTAVSFGGVNATSITIVSDSQITAVVGSGESGDVVVHAPGGAGTKSGFTFVSSIPADPTSITPSVNPICHGSSTVLTANGAEGTVYWYTVSCGVTATSPATGNTLTVSPTVTTTYYARNYNNGTFSAGCASKTITVDPTSVGGTAKW